MILRMTCHQRVLSTTVSALVLLLGLWGCGDKKDDAASTPTFTTVYKDTLSGCAAGRCHNGESVDTKDGPDFSTQAKAYAALVGKTLGSYTNWSENGAGGCGEQMLITASDASKSIIAGILDEAVKPGGCTPGYTNHASVHKVSVAAAKVTDLKSWINAGAKND